MGRAKKKVQNRLLPKVLQLEQALGAQVERPVIIDVLKSVGEDVDRAMELLVQMVVDAGAVIEHSSQPDDGLSAFESVQAAPLESKADDPDDGTPDQQQQDQQQQQEDNTSSDLSEQVNGNWEMLVDMFKGLLSVDELADMYQMQNLDLESTVASALNTVDDDCGDNTAVFDEIATNSDYHFQQVDVVMDSVLQSLASLTSEQSAVVETLERVFPDHDVSVLLGVAETVQFDVDQAVAMLLDGGTLDTSATSPAQNQASRQKHRTYAEAMSGQQAGSLVSKMADPVKKEQEFPQLRPEPDSRSQPNSQSPGGADAAVLSVADKLKLHELHLMYPGAGRSTIRSLYIANDRSAHNVMMLLGNKRPNLSERVTTQPTPSPPRIEAAATMGSPGSAFSSSPEQRPRLSPADGEVGSGSGSGGAAATKKASRKTSYVPWTTVEAGRKNKKQQPERYIPGLNQPTTESKPVDTEEYWREQANLAKQRMREAFLHAAQLRRELGGDAAHEAAARGQYFKEQMNTFNSRAAACTIRDRNDGGVQADVVDSTGAVCYRNPQASESVAPTSYVRVDLHGLFVREAIQFLASLIDQYSAAKSKVTVDAITGVGNNSQGGRARLMEATVRLLQQKQLPYKVSGGTVRFKT